MMHFMQTHRQQYSLSDDEAIDINSILNYILSRNNKTGYSSLLNSFADNI